MKNSKSLTPFLFTSEKELTSTNGQWYTMWINPQTLGSSFSTNSSESLTNSGYEFFHWQNTLPKLTFSGVSGWLFGGKSDGTNIIQLVDGIVDDVEAAERTSNPDFFEYVSIFDKNFQDTGGILDFETPGTVEKNDARTFVNRLERVALQSKFFFDITTKYRRFNTKHLRFYSKRYPNGRTISGFFTSFRINEDALDAQYIPYQCEFVVQSGLEDSVTEEFNLLKEFSFRDNSIIRFNYND